MTDASDLQGRQLLAGLDKVASDLDRQEKAITGILRPPLEQGRAIEDSAERAKDLKVLPGWGSCSRFHLCGALGHSKQVLDNYRGNYGESCPKGQGPNRCPVLELWRIPDVIWLCF